MLKAGTFVVPSAPVLRAAPPQGDGWLHEVKFDGWRAQLHKVNGKGVVFSRRGSDISRRFRVVAEAVTRLRCDSVIIDAEIVVSGEDGAPDFEALMKGDTGQLCAWCFDVLLLDGVDLRKLPLAERKKALRRVLKNKKAGVLRYSEAFKDGDALMASAEEMALEGVVSKKADQAYVSGRNRGWVKSKTAGWRRRNRNRGELFGQSRA